MTAYIAGRLMQAVGVLLAIGLISFALFRFAGDPVNQMVGMDTPPAERAAIRRSLGLDDPVLVQFGRFLGRAARLEFGVSYQIRQPVSQLLAERIPATLELAFCATLLAVGLGVPAGVFAALERRTASAKLLQAVSLVGVSLPTFLIGNLLIWAFSVTLGLLPSFGRGETVRLGWWTTGFLTLSGLKALILPTVTLGLFQMALIMRLVRAGMLETLNAEFIRFAHARGLSPRVVYFGHTLKNTLAPVLAVAGLQVGSVVAFALVTETVFQWPGMGLLLVQAVQAADVPIMAAYLLLAGVIFVTVNLAVDILCVIIDPRLRRPFAS